MPGQLLGQLATIVDGWLTAPPLISLHATLWAIMSQTGLLVLGTSAAALLVLRSTRR